METIYGKNGNDIIHANSGDDTLHGGLGDDTLYGGDGNDTLYGESGNDELVGGYGNDVYKFSRGFGKDTINNNDSTGYDIAKLSYDYTGMIFEKNGRDLLINESTENQVKITNHFYSSSYKIDEVQLESNFKITSTNIDLLIQAMSEYCTTNGVEWTKSLMQSNTEVQDMLMQYYETTE